MTAKQFETAEMIQRQIQDIDVLLTKLCNSGEFRCEPPTRMSGIHIATNDLLSSNSWCHDLNQGEVVTIIEALKSMKSLLEFEFGRL